MIIMSMVGFLQNDEAISPVIGAVLILAIGATTLTYVQLNFVPVWNTQEELDHLEKVNDDFKELKSSIESSAVSGTSLSSPLSMGFKYSPKIIAYNPRESAYATLSIQKDTWAEVRYNEVLSEGMEDATSIKNISTSTITYSLHGTNNYKAFIYEHGLIRREGSNFTSSSQTLVSNDTIYLLGINVSESESTSGLERKAINIYPASQVKNSVIGSGVWLILRTRPEYIEWWESSIKKEGGNVRKKDNISGTIIAYFNKNITIRMGETQITTSPRTSPSKSPQKRLVKVTPQSVNLPVEGITNIEVEVQDFYNNPVQNVVVNFNINSSKAPSNAYANAELLQTSAVSGADGRASVQLRTRGAGMYYIDAGITNYNTTFSYPASSQGGFISLSYTGSEPEYNITAALKNGFGETITGNTVAFAVSEGNVNPGSDNDLNSDGLYNTTLNSTSASGLKIKNIQTSGVKNSSATITWDTINTITVAANRTPGGYVFNSIEIPTKVSTNGCVLYGTSSGNYPYINCDSQRSSHNVTLSSLLPETVYYFIANSSRTGGESTNSSEYMLVTTPETIPTPPASVTNLTNATYAPLYINWTWTDPGDADFAYVQVYINSTFKGTVNKGVQFYSANYFRPNSTHTISTRTVDSSGNVNETWVNSTANTSTVFTYVFDFLSTNGTVAGAGNAANASDSGASATLSEEATNFSATYNWSFTPPILNNESWIFSYTYTTATGNTVLKGGSNSTDGVPPGSLFASLSATTGFNRNVITSWRSPNITWTNGTPVSATLNFSFRVTQLTLASTTATSAVFLMDPNGVKKQINQSTTYTAQGAWGNFSNSSIVLTDFSIPGNYSLLLNATLFTTNNGALVNVSWDNPSITLDYNTYSLNITTNTTDIPESSTQILQLRYNVSNDNFTLQLWNGSSWNNRTTLNDTAISYRNITLLTEELIPDGTLTGSAADLNKYFVLVRYLDLNASAAQGRLYLDYQRVYSG